MKRLDYWRCIDCLAVMTIAQVLRGKVVCSCGGRAEFLGTVHRDHLRVTGQGTPCDSRCTNATGPSCNCSCGGENHGTRRLVEVTVRVDRIPQLHSPNHEAGGAFRAAVKALDDAFIARYPRAAGGGYLPADVYDAVLGFRRKRAAAFRARSAKSRIRILTDAASEYLSR